MNPVTFKCLRSGNTVSFTLSGDIEQMRKHEGYVEVLDSPVPTVSAEPVVSKTIKVKGKREVPSFLIG